MPLGRVARVRVVRGATLIKSEDAQLNNVVYVDYLQEARVDVEFDHLALGVAGGADHRLDERAPAPQKARLVGV